MNLPEDLQHFPHPALLITSDSVMAKIYLLGGDQMQELDGVSLPRERSQNEDGSAEHSDHSGKAGFDGEAHDEPRLHEFIHQLEYATEHLVHEHSIAYIHLVMPAEIEHQLTGHLPKDIQAKIGRTLHLDVMKEDPLHVVKRLLLQA